MKSILCLALVTTMSIWDTSHLTNASPFKSKKLDVIQLYEKNSAAATSLMENIAKKFPDSFPQQMNVDAFLEKNSAVSATTMDKIYRELSPAPERIRAENLSGSYFDMFSHDSAYASQSLYNEEGPLMSTSIYMGDPDIDGKSMADTAVMLVNDTVLLSINSVQHHTTPDAYSTLASGILYSPEDGRIQIMEYEDHLLGTVGILAGQMNAETHKVTVSVGAYRFEEIYDFKSACKSYQMCTVSGCTKLD